MTLEELKMLEVDYVEADEFMCTFTCNITCGYTSNVPQPKGD